MTTIAHSTRNVPLIAARVLAGLLGAVQLAGASFFLLIADRDQVLAPDPARRTARPSGPQLVMASLASGTLIIGLYIGAVVMTFPIILFFVTLAFVGVGGRKLIEWAPIGARWGFVGREIIYD